LLRAGEAATASFALDSAQAVFLWRAATGVVASLSLTSENGTTSHVTLMSDWGVRAMARNATLNLSADVTLQVWQIPRALCTGPVLFYSAPVAFSDDLRPSSATEFCAFFGHAQFHATVDGTSRARLFTAANAREPAARCDRIRACTFESTQSSFLYVPGIEKGERTTLEFTAKSDTDQPCDRSFIPLVIENAVYTLEMPLDPSNRFSCSVTSTHHSYFMIFGVVFMALACLALLVLFGWCSRVQLLREDQIQHLISIVPEGEEEDAAEGVTPSAPARQSPTAGPPPRPRNPRTTP
jgi:hypothetical protein